MIKEWRKQVSYKEPESKAVDLSKMKVADLWLYTFKKFNELSFSSSDQGKNHQVSPLDFSLSIPDEKFLKGFDSSRTQLALMGVKIEKENIDKNNATIYHELFHVLQVSYTKTAFDYFYLVDELQGSRKNLLKFLTDLNFFDAISNEAMANTQSIFHYVEIYGQELTQHLKKIIKKNIDSRADEIDFELNSILEALDEEEKTLAIKIAEKHKMSYSNQANSILKEKIKEVIDSEESLSRLADLSKPHIEKILKYFDYPKDLDIHTFHLIEGSAEVFGLCCGGYNASANLEQRISASSPADDMYVKAYQLFRENKGKTPILFIVFVLFCLRYGSPTDTENKTPADIFTWGLKNVEHWELGFEKTDSSMPFELIIEDLVEKIGNSIRGGFFINNESISVYDKDDFLKNSGKSIFSIRLSNVRSNFESEKEFCFLSKIIIDHNAAIEIIKPFRTNEEFTFDLRKNQVFRDYEKILLDPNLDYEIQCCSEHGELERFDEILSSCHNSDSFVSILKSHYNLDIPLPN